MSLILDALKKLDREKAVKSGGNVNISSEILKGDSEPGKKGFSSLLVIVGITAGVAGVITYLVAAGPGVRSTDSRQKAPVHQAAASVVVTTQDTGSGPSVNERPPVPGTGMTKERTDGVQNIPASDNAAAQGKAPAQPEESSAVRPVLKISGIVWQEERSERKAMINNTVAREGDTVEGAKILEIHPSHVLVSFKGQSFKVTMFE